MLLCTPRALKKSLNSTGMVPACLERTQAYSDTDDAKVKQDAINVVANNEVKMSNIYKDKRQVQMIYIQMLYK